MEWKGTIETDAELNGHVQSDEEMVGEILEISKGDPGKDGKDGVSVSHRWNGSVLIITSASGTSSADLKGNAGDPNWACNLHVWESNGSGCTLDDNFVSLELSYKGTSGQQDTSWDTIRYAESIENKDGSLALVNEQKVTVSSVAAAAVLKGKFVYAKKENIFSYYYIPQDATFKQTTHGAGSVAIGYSIDVDKAQKVVAAEGVDGPYVASNNRYAYEDSGAYTYLGQLGDAMKVGGVGGAGEDGFSPIAIVEQTEDGALITITDKNGTTTATITNGKDGASGSGNEGIFIARYGTTTWEELKEAGYTTKVVIATDSSSGKVASLANSNADIIRFARHDGKERKIEIWSINSSSTWSRSFCPIVSTVDGVEKNESGNVVLNAVRYVAQELTEEQKAQARENIGATSDVLFVTYASDTTYEEIVNAANEGKVCILCLSNGSYAPLSQITEDKVVFSHTIANGEYLLIRDYYRPAIGGWGWDQVNSTEAINSGSPSYHLASAKGVYNYAQPKGEYLTYTPQALNAAQQEQARANIGAAAAEVPREKAEIIVSFKANAAINNNNQFTTYEASAGVACRYTNTIPVIEGDRFSYTGGSASLSSHPNAIFFDSNENIVSVEKWGANITNGCKLVTVPPGVAFVRFCDSGYWGVTSEDQLNENRKLHFEVLHMPREDEEREIVVNGRVGGYYNSTTYGWFAVDGMCAKRTDPIPVSESDTFYWTTADGGRSYMHWYDVNGTRIAVVTGDGTQMTLTPPADAVMARFFAYSYSTNLDNCILNVAYKTDDKTIEYLQGMNYLWGKKYVACGDSFTAGDFAEKTEETWDDAMQEYKTYCWHIAKRNRMQLVNEAISGSTMYNKDSNSFSVTRYTAVPKDADYITLCFGLNDQSAGADIGTLQDTTNATVIGAWNVVLEYLITNIPYAKIGIIIADAYLNSTMRDALVSVAKYWGIPYLDLKGDPKVPMLIGGRYSDVTVSSKAIQLRNTAFQISETDSHPNAKGHAYRSTIIENFMRSL